MSTVYDWTFEEPQKVTMGSLSGVVRSIPWTLTGARDGYIFSRSGTAILKPPVPESFIPDDDLTDELLTEWVQGTMAVDGTKSGIEMDLDNAVYSNAPKPATVAPDIIPAGFQAYAQPDESVSDLRLRLASVLQGLLSRFGDSTGQLVPLTSGDKVRMYEMIVANSAAGDWLGVGSINLEG
jgi:hypothetical protein